MFYTTSKTIANILWIFKISPMNTSHKHTHTPASPWLAQYTELFPHCCNTLLLQGSVKTFQLLFSFFALKKISQVHQVCRNYPFSITFSQLWWNSSQIARLFKVKVALSPNLKTVCWFAEMDLSASDKKKTRALVGFCSKMWTHNDLKVDNTDF